MGGGGPGVRQAPEPHRGPTNGDGLQHADNAGPRREALYRAPGDEQGLCRIPGAGPSQVHRRHPQGERRRQEGGTGEHVEVADRAPEAQGESGGGGCGALPHLPHIRHERRGEGRGCPGAVAARDRVLGHRGDAQVQDGDEPAQGCDGLGVEKDEGEVSHDAAPARRLPGWCHTDRAGRGDDHAGQGVPGAAVARGPEVAGAVPA
mmetsp:Transcript_42648/g.99164  ORF Transcript_42648/g.99164 Transcript_42648/m.99164 type:complete len:205 (-) Transcript_42648:622-1236(-)